MQGHAVGRENRLVQHLAERRVREDGVGEFRVGQFAGARDGVAVDQFAITSAPIVAIRQQLAGIGIEHRFHRGPQPPAQSDGLGVADEREAGQP